MAEALIQYAGYGLIGACCIALFLWATCSRWLPDFVWWCLAGALGLTGAWAVLEAVDAVIGVAVHVVRELWS